MERILMPMMSPLIVIRNPIISGCHAGRKNRGRLRRTEKIAGALPLHPGHHKTLASISLHHSFKG